MESLALAALIVGGPALYGGPIAFLLSVFQPQKMSRFRRWSIWILAILAMISGAYLLFVAINDGFGFGNIGVIGFLGLLTGTGAIRRMLRLRELS